MKHTPGPWELKVVQTSVGICFKIGPFPSNAADETHACVYADHINEQDFGHSYVGNTLRANARLIATAPELLAALEDAVSFFEGYRDKLGEYEGLEDDIAEYKVVIAKAKGESE